MSNQANPNMPLSHRKLAGRYYILFGIALFLLGVMLMIIPHAFHKEGEVWKVLSEIGTFLALIVSLHFIYEIIVKKEDRQILIHDLDTLLKQHHKAINSTLELSRATIFKGQEETYSAAAEVIARTSLNLAGEKSILLCALHGHSGKRRTVRQDSTTGFEYFSSQMRKCINSSGTGMWQVREIYNITDEDRLEMILKRLENADNSVGYEVRAFCLQNVLPQLSPLVIGDKDLFIGWDDTTYYGPKQAIHIKGQEFVRSGTEYFESLWNDKRLFVLRSNLGIEADKVKSIRVAMKALPKFSNDRKTPTNRKRKG